MQPAGRVLSIAANAKKQGYVFPRHWLYGIAFVVVGVLAGCSTSSQQAPITDLSAGSTGTVAPSSQARAAGSYTVKAGDTLYKIARAHNVSVQELAAANQILDPAQLRVGQSLAIPGGVGAAGSQTIDTGTQVVVAPVDVGTGVQPTPAAKPKESTEVKPSASTESGAPRASDADLINWGWPTQGKIIQSFTPSSKGIDLEGRVGEPVVAAADGKVMYAGNGVRGLGNLILLGHSDGFITAYAHNDALLVKTGEEVKKGQKIATLGQSEASSPRLHFEIRRRGTPVNPMSYLPKR